MGGVDTRSVSQSVISSLSKGDNPVSLTRLVTWHLLIVLLGKKWVRGWLRGNDADVTWCTGNKQKHIASSAVHIKNADTTCIQNRITVVNT